MVLSIFFDYFRKLYLQKLTNIDMKKHFVFLLLTILLAGSGFAQLSTQAKVSLLTCGPGNEFYESFGHSAIRIKDDSLKMDLSFNYGMFSFGEPNFYLKFAQGRLPYMLGVYPTDLFMVEYITSGRSVTEQVLNFTLEEKNRLYNALVENYKPENRYYAYDFFRDNCATRVRDMLELAAGRPVFSTQYAAGNPTYRKLYYHCTDNMLWWRLGIDLLLGARADKKLTETECTYIPFDLQNQVDTVVYQCQAGDWVLATNYLSRQTKSEVPPTKFTPFMVFGIFFLLVLILTIVEYRKKCYCKAFDIVFFAIIAVFSLLLLLMTFCTDHYTTKYNFNLLWANPLFWWILLRMKKTPVWCIYVLASCLTVSLLCFGLLPQMFNIAILPLILSIGLRLFALYRAKTLA